MIFALLITFQIKHFLADFPLQTPYMLRKFLPDWSFFLPLVCHCLVHAVMTGIIAYVVNPKVALLCVGLDSTIHFVMDRLKAGPKYLGRFKSLTALEFINAKDEQKVGNKLFWWSLGLDQMVHHLTHYLIIWILLNV